MKLKILNEGLAQQFAAAAGQGSITFAEKTGPKTAWKLTRINGNGYKLILDNFKFSKALPSDNDNTAKIYQDAWDGFREIYQNLNTPKPWSHHRMENKVKMWFAQCLGGYCDTTVKGKKVKKNDPLFLASFLLTPYFHCLLCHVHEMLKVGDLFSFSGQSFEKCNHTHQRIQAAATNHRVGEDSKSVAQQHLRIRFNTIGLLSSNESDIPCDEITCTVRCKSTAGWITHHKRKHPDTVHEETEVESLRRAGVAQSHAVTAIEARLAIGNATHIIQDINDAYNALLTMDREKSNTYYQEKGKDKRKVRRQAQKTLDEFDSLQSIPAPEM